MTRRRSSGVGEKSPDAGAGAEEARADEQNAGGDAAVGRNASSATGRLSECPFVLVRRRVAGGASPSVPRAFVIASSPLLGGVDARHPNVFVARAGRGRALATILAVLRTALEARSVAEREIFELLFSAVLFSLRGIFSHLEEGTI